MLYRFLIRFYDEIKWNKIQYNIIKWKFNKIQQNGMKIKRNKMNLNVIKWNRIKNCNKIKKRIK